MSRIPVLLLLAICAAFLMTTATADAASAKPAKKCSLKKKAKCKKAKLVKQKIGKRDLSGANLAGATITGTTFTGTTLRNVDLSRAKLTNVTFKDVDLTGASFANAKLRGVRFVGLRSPASRASCEYLDGSQDVQGVTILGVGCGARGASFVGARFAMSFFWNSDLERADFTDAVVDDTFVAFFGCNLRNARFVGTIAPAFYASDLDLFEDMFSYLPRGSVPSASVERQTDLSNALLDDAVRVSLGNATNASGASFVGATFSSSAQWTNPGPGVNLTGATGLNGSASVRVTVAAHLQGTALKESERDTKSPTLSTRISDSSKLVRTRFCLYGQDCSLKVAYGLGATVRVVAREAIVGSGSGGTTCTTTTTADDLFVVTCAVPALPTVSTPVEVSIVKSASGAIAAGVPIAIRDPRGALSRTIIQIADSERGFGTDANALTCQARADSTCAGLITACADGACTATVPKDSWVRVTMLRQMSNAYFAVNCPGESGDPIANARTEWPTGSVADPPPYALRRVCTFRASDASPMDVVMDGGS